MNPDDQSPSNAASGGKKPRDDIIKNRGQLTKL